MSYEIAGKGFRNANEFYLLAVDAVRKRITPRSLWAVSTPMRIDQSDNPSTCKTAVTGSLYGSHIDITFTLDGLEKIPSLSLERPFKAAVLENGKLPDEDFEEVVRTLSEEQKRRNYSKRK